MSSNIELIKQDLFGTPLPHEIGSDARWSRIVLGAMVSELDRAIREYGDFKSIDEGLNEVSSRGIALPFSAETRRDDHRLLAAQVLQVAVLAVKLVDKILREEKEKHETTTSKA